MAGMLVGFFPSAGSGDVVTLSGQSLYDSNKSPGNAYVHLKIDNDGNVYESEGSATPSYIQIDTVNDWVRPAGSSPGLYEVMFTKSGDALFSSTVAAGVWHSLSAGDFVLQQRETGTGNPTTVCTVNIRYNGGAILATNTYNLECEVITK